MPFRIWNLWWWWSISKEDNLSSFWNKKENSNNKKLSSTLNKLSVLFPIAIAKALYIGTWNYKIFFWEKITKLRSPILGLAVSLIGLILNLIGAHSNTCLLKFFRKNRKSMLLQEISGHVVLFYFIWWKDTFLFLETHLHK